MKKTIYMLLALMSLQGAKAAPFPAGTEIKCFQNQQQVFVVKTGDKFPPRVAPFDDAILSFTQGKNDWHWLQLASYKEGALGAQHSYKLYAGGQLLISEVLKSGIGCGRRICDNELGPKVLHATLIGINGQQNVFSCLKTK